MSTISANCSVNCQCISSYDYQDGKNMVNIYTYVSREGQWYIVGKPA